MASIAAARYGKDNVRVYKVEKDEKTGVQTVTEMTVCVLLEGAIDVSYTKADNSVVVGKYFSKGLAPLFLLCIR
jgi:urate oxidase